MFLSHAKVCRTCKHPLTLTDYTPHLRYALRYVYHAATKFCRKKLQSLVEAHSKDFVILGVAVLIQCLNVTNRHTSRLSHTHRR